MTENDTKTHDRPFLPTGQNRTPKTHRQTDMPPFNKEEKKTVQIMKPAGGKKNVREHVCTLPPGVPSILTDKREEKEEEEPKPPKN